MLWTVVRLPDGTWSTGGMPDDPDYAECEIFRVDADSRERAKKKAQALRSRTSRTSRTRRNRQSTG